MDTLVNPASLTLTPEQSQLATELGWETADPQVAPWLRCLLDDEFEQLEPTERGRLRSQLAGVAGVEVCPECGNVFLCRFRPDDSRCRVCAAPLDAPPSPVEALQQPAVDQARAPAAAWSQVPLALQRAVSLDDENEDWDEREDRLEALQAAEREAEARRRRQHELARQQAEARREAREAKRRALTELIPPVSDTRLTQLKRKAHADIEARLEANRRKRRLMRGGKARPR